MHVPRRLELFELFCVYQSSAERRHVQSLLELKAAATLKSKLFIENVNSTFYRFAVYNFSENRIDYLLCLMEIYSVGVPGNDLFVAVVCPLCLKFE